MVQAAITRLLASACQAHGGPAGKATPGKATPGAAGAPFARGFDHLPADLGALPALCIGARSGPAPETAEGYEVMAGTVDLEALAVTPLAETPQTGAWGGSPGASKALAALFEKAGSKRFAVLRWRQYEAVWGGREVFVSAVILRSHETL